MKRFEFKQGSSSNISSCYNCRKTLTTIKILRYDAVEWTLTFDLQGGSSYDLLIEMYESLPHYTERLEYWRERLKEVRGRTERLQ